MKPEDRRCGSCRNYAPEDGDPLPYPGRCTWEPTGPWPFWVDRELFDPVNPDTDGANCQTWEETS